MPSPGARSSICARSNPAAPDRWALRRGIASWLGACEPQYLDPDPVPVWRTPLGWLRAGCRGLVLLTEDKTDRYRCLSMLGSIVAEDQAHTADCGARSSGPLRCRRSKCGAMQHDDLGPTPWDDEPEPRPRPRPRKPRAANGHAGGPATPAYSDDALALEFSDRHAGALRYCHQWGAGLHWDGARWQFERTLHVFDMARRVARDFAAACNKQDAAAKRIASAGTVAAIERLARSDRRHATETGDWDAAEHAGRHCRPSHWQAAAARPKPLYHQGYSSDTGRRLPNVEAVNSPSDQW
jgi:hypothetical protein